MNFATLYLDKENYQGIMGLSDQIKNNVFLEDGVYTLWNRNANSPISDGLLPGKNMYASSPFYMGKAADPKKSWFGVYHNNVGASDWWIFNDDTTGNAFVETYTVGGIGDLYLMTGDTPERVTQLY